MIWTVLFWFVALPLVVVSIALVVDIVRMERETAKTLREMREDQRHG